MDYAELLLGQIPEAIYFALFMIFTKQLKEKRVLFVLLMIIEYLLLKSFIKFSMWFQMAYTAFTYVILKVLYKDKAQITDIFTFTIGSISLIFVSAISFGIFRPNMIVGAIINRVILIIFFIFLYDKLPYIQKVYKKLWNRNDKVKNKIKSATFRSINVVIFNLIFYIINLGMMYMLWLRK